MLHFFEMKKLFISLLIALPMLFVACDKEPVKEPDQQPDVVTLSRLSDAEVNFEAEGGMGEIRYELKNATDITQLKAECSVEWIDIDDITMGEVISYVVAVNDQPAERVATIRVSYNDLSFDVKVMQAATAYVEGWAIVGSMTNDWDVASAIAMSAEGDYFAARGVVLTTADSFKFIKDGSYAESRGGQGYLAEPNHYYEASRSGSDVRVKEDGRYDIYLNATLDAYYIMAEGVSPDEAEDGSPETPNVPDDTANASWSIMGDFVDNSWSEALSLKKNVDYAVVEDVSFANSDGRGLVFKLYRNGGESEADIYGVATERIYSLDTPIAPTSLDRGGSHDIVVEADTDALYDIFFDAVNLKLWVVADGEYPTMDVDWTSAEGILFSSNNYCLSLMSQGLNLYLDFYCEVHSEGIIPEATYYVDEELGGENILSVEGSQVAIHGIKTSLLDGEMTITHISGGYRIDIEILTFHMHRIKVCYEGPLAENPYLGQPVVNPE